MEKSTTKLKPQYLSVTEPKYRIFEIDLIRGIAIALVIIDHLMFMFYDFGVQWLGSDLFLDSAFFSIYKFAKFYWNHPVRIAIRYFVIGLFFFVSGISSSFVKSNLKRGLKMLIIAIGVTVVTYIFSYVFNVDYQIDFNVIHCFALSTLIYAAIEREKPWVTILISILSFLVALAVYLINPVVSTKAFLIFGITPVGYVAGDYSSLFPWLGIFLIGGLFGQRFYGKRASLLTNRERKGLRPLLFLGRNSIWFYFIEQIALLGIFYLLGILYGFWG